MYKFLHEYVKPKCTEKAKLCYIGTNGFIAYIKTDDIYKDTEEDVETSFDSSNNEYKRPLPKGNNKKCYWFNEG